MTSGPRDRLHPLLATRWSPRIFDPAHELTLTQVDLLLEAARWAPSAGNSQPWAFYAGRRGDPMHGRIVAFLTSSSRPWATTASLLVVNLCHRYVEDTDWEYSEFALYDLGQAVAHMTIQAQAMGLAARQFRAFDAEGLTAELAVPAHWQVVSMTAFGVTPADASPRAADKVGERLRRHLADVRWATGNLPDDDAPEQAR